MCWVSSILGADTLVSTMHEYTMPFANMRLSPTMHMQRTASSEGATESKDILNGYRRSCSNIADMVNFWWVQVVVDQKSLWIATSSYTFRLRCESRNVRYDGQFSKKEKVQCRGY